MNDLKIEQFRKVANVVEAVRLTEDNIEKIIKWLDESKISASCEYDLETNEDEDKKNYKKIGISINTNNEETLVKVGDYLVKDDGYFYKCTSAMFHYQHEKHYNEEDIHINNAMFRNLREGINTMLNRTLAGMIVNDKRDADITLKLKISCEKRYLSEENIVMIPQFEHKISAVMKTENSIKGQVLNNNLQLELGEEGCVLSKIKSPQLSLDELKDEEDIDTSEEEFEYEIDEEFEEDFEDEEDNDEEDNN